MCLYVFVAQVLVERCFENEEGFLGTFPALLFAAACAAICCMRADVLQ